MKPAGRDLGPAIPAADQALEGGSADHLLKLLTGVVRQGVRERFENTLARRKFRSDDLGAGRAYVQAYVEFLHYVERVHGAAGPGEAHGHEEKH